MATVIIDNKSGMYSPDSTGAWNKVLWLNKTITNHHGLRSRARRLFTGIDEIMETNYPAELSIVARDYSKALTSNRKDG